MPRPAGQGASQGAGQVTVRRLGAKGSRCSGPMAACCRDTAPQAPDPEVSMSARLHRNRGPISA